MWSTFPLVFADFFPLQVYGPMNPNLFFNFSGLWQPQVGRDANGAAKEDFCPSRIPQNTDQPGERVEDGHLVRTFGHRTPQE